MLRDKRCLGLILFILVISLLNLLMIFPSVNAIDYSDKASITSRVDLRGAFDIVPKSRDSTIGPINATLVSYPKADYRQKIISFKTDPQYSYLNEKQNSIGFYWDNPKQNALDFTLEFTVHTENIFIPVRTKVKYPTPSLDNDYYAYIVPTQTIDIDDNIRTIASNITSNTNDLFAIEYKFAEYVRRNIHYDLGTLTADANQKSSWVLENKKGVCDEITNLFISLNRASGIPARTVSGIAYTNLDVFGSNWVPHQWAEVYFPEYGWIPFDVTYGEYGYIDAAHIKLLDNYDSISSGVKYEYYGYNVNLRAKQLNTDVFVKDSGPQMKSGYTFTTKLYASNVGFGSYNIIQADIVNNNDYYQVADLYLGNTEKVSIIDNSVDIVLNQTIHRKETLLKPKEHRTIYWVLLLNDTVDYFDNDFMYTLPITVYSQYNETSTVNMFARKDYVMIDRQSINNAIQSSYTEISDTKSALLTCAFLSDKNLNYMQRVYYMQQIYVNNTVTVNCTIQNPEKIFLGVVELCLEDSCTTINADTITNTNTVANNSAGIASIILSKKLNTVGLHNIEIRANKNNIRPSYLTLNVIDYPHIIIADMKYPLKARYNDLFDVGFTLRKDSVSEPLNVSAILENPVMRQDWTINKLDSDKKFILQNDGSFMKPNENLYTINVTYYDTEGRAYYELQHFIVVSDANFLQMSLLWANQMIYTFENSFS